MVSNGVSHSSHADSEGWFKYVQAGQEMQLSEGSAGEGKWDVEVCADVGWGEGLGEAASDADLGIPHKEHLGDGAFDMPQTLHTQDPVLLAEASAAGEPLSD